MRITFTPLATLVCSISLMAAAPTPGPGTLPAWFEQSRAGLFHSRGTEGEVRIEGTRADLSFRTSTEGGAEGLRWSLVGAGKEAKAAAGREKGSKSSYFTGNDRAAWRHGVGHFADVRIPGAYPGVDVVWYASGHLLEYDFVVAAGADAGAIRFRIDGAKARLTKDGDLEYTKGGLTVRQAKPVAYQLAGGVRREIDASYQLARDGSVGFELGDYDRGETLVIDPVLSYSGYLGGTGVDVAAGVSFDTEGAMWITGTTGSQVDSNWAREPYASVRVGGRDAFLARLVERNGSWALDHWTYIGGAQDDEAVGLAMGPNNLIYIAGRTLSTDFPIAGDPHQTKNAGEGDAFLLRYNPIWDSNAAIEYSTYIGSSASEVPIAVAANAKGWATVAGYTLSGTLPTGALNGPGNSPLQPSNRGGFDGFIYTFNTYGSASETLLMATFLGGVSTDVINGVAMDADGLVYITGLTMSPDFPIEGASYQGFYQEQGDAFLAVIDPRQSGFDSFKYATFFGGENLDVAMGIRIDSSGIVWITGYTLSPNFPLSPGANKTAIGGQVDAFVAGLDWKKAGAGFVKYSSFVGGEGADIGYAVEKGPGETVVVAGYTDSGDYPVKNPPVSQSESGLGPFAFTTSLDTAKSGAAALNYSALFGGRGIDVATSLATGPAGVLGLVGNTTSPDLRVAGSSKPNASGLRTTFFIKLNPDPAP